MKISFMMPHLKLFGGTRRIIELSNRLTKRGHDVTIFHSDGSPCEWMRCVVKIKSHKELFNEEFDVVINAWAPFYHDFKKTKAKLKVFFVLVLYERWLLKREVITQLLLIVSDIYNGYRRIKGKLSRITFLRIVSGHLKNPSLKKQALHGPNAQEKNSLLRRLTSNPSHIRAIKKSLFDDCLNLCNSTWSHQFLMEELGVSAKLLLGGVNPEIFHPVEVRKNFDGIRILCSGDPRERKGTKTILEAFDIARKDEPTLILDTYHGKGIAQEKLAEKYCSADIFVDGQWYACWNNPVVEAMACKVPVVCTDIGGVKDFAFHEKTALLVSPKDSHAMASAILRLIGDAKLRETLRENAHNHIRQFNWDKSATRLEEILSAEVKYGEG